MRLEVLRGARPTGRQEDGLTLVELLIVMVLLTIVGTIAAGGMVQGMRTTAHAQDRMEALAHTQTGMARVSRDLRAADPLEVAQTDRVEVAVRRDDRLYYYIYRAEADGDLWNLAEERWQFDDGFDEPGFVPAVGDADVVTSRVLVPQLRSSDVFTFSGRQVDIRLERIVQAGRAPIIVETTVQMRNG